MSPGEGMYRREGPNPRRVGTRGVEDYGLGTSSLEPEDRSTSTSTVLSQVPSDSPVRGSFYWTTSGKSLSLRFGQKVPSPVSGVMPVVKT